jgi:hypothetical protein
MNKTRIAIAAALITAITSPVFAAGSAQKHRASYDDSAYANAGQLQPGSVTEQRWFDRASSPRND